MTVVSHQVCMFLGISLLYRPKLFQSHKQSLYLWATYPFCICDIVLTILSLLFVDSDTSTVFSIKNEDFLWFKTISSLDKFDLWVFEVSVVKNWRTQFCGYRKVFAQLSIFVAFPLTLCHSTSSWESSKLKHVSSWWQ